MNFKNLLLPATALGLSAVLLIPAEQAGAFTVLGGNLTQTDRQFRIFNNFSDVQANDNTTPDPQFPGYTGAVLAIWKGVVEWGSELHGNGSGDPHQPSGLGSGGANFDASFQGENNSAGGINSNTFSELNGNGNGVLAFHQAQGSSNWHILFYSNLTWHDGPGTNIGSAFSGNYDLQGVACHEYGHALGLNHSGFSSATMSANASGNAVSDRSLHSDDIAGVQSIYGVKAGNKPVITDIVVNGNSITVTGANFSASGNQLWFTQAGIGGSGTPIKVTNLTSNGTTLVATIPGSAGPGDVLARNNSTGNDDLSNAFPHDLQDDGPTCSHPVIYCTTTANSVGSGAIMSWGGSPSPSLNNFSLSAFGTPPNQFGIFFYGGGQTLNLFGDGLICVASGGVGITRFNALQADSFGDVFMPIDFSAPPLDAGSNQWATGTQWYVQWWYRDPAAGGTGFNLSNALDITICP